MTLEELRERQQWTLSQKIDHTLGVIDQFVSRQNGKVYLAFSGGKDSTVLMHLCEIIKKDIPCVFVNTGCEYLDIVKFVENCKQEHNIVILRPAMKPKEVWAKYGFPLASKEAAENVHAVRTNPTTIKAKKALGILDPDSQFVLAKKWRYLINEPYETSNACCTILKKKPSSAFQKETGLSAIIGTMASESMLREKTYIRRGSCNVFGVNANSLPLSIWTEEDIWQFIKENHVKIADIYYKGASRTGCVACGFGCQFKDDQRLKVLYKLYPRYYEAIMNYQNNGVTYREALRKMLAVNKLYLPDETPKTPKQLTLF